jgi:hypothetical protein
MVLMIGQSWARVRGVKKRFSAFVAAAIVGSSLLNASISAGSISESQNPVVAKPDADTIQVDQNFLPAEPGFARDHDCTNKDYRSQLGPYHNQGETGLCFAYTSAELIRHRTGRSVSALDLATTFYFGDVTLLPSKLHPILREYLAQHPDFEKAIFDARMDSDIGVVPLVRGSTETHPMFHKIEGGFEVPTILLANIKDLCSDESLPSHGGLKQHLGFILPNEKAALNQVGVVGPEVDVLIGRFRDPVADIFNTAWLRYVAAKCKRAPSEIPVVPVTFAIARDIGDYHEKLAAGKITSVEKARLIAALNYVLDHRRIATIGFDLSTILDPNSEEVKKWSNPDDPEDGDHSSLVVARRKVGGHCEYLIRDPSGYECKDYLSKYSKRCSNHHIWLAESELLESFYDLAYLR